MRSTQKEISTIIEHLKIYSPTGKVYLHGSRLDNSRKGGDIDLFFIVSDDEFNKLTKISYKINAELSLKLNEQRVDLLILSENKANNHEFSNNSVSKKLSE